MFIPSSQILNRQAEQQIYDFEAGVLMLIDKPLHWTSFDVVNKLKYTIKHKFGYKKIKIGHAGTLDPLASGLLLVCTGKFTKTIENLQSASKLYTGTIIFGGTTPTYDREFEPTEFFPFSHIDEELLKGVLPQFVGEIDQVPPIYSALKIDGQKAYQLARKGKEPTMKSRKVHIYSFDLQIVKMPEVAFVVHCSKGTYIRSLAHDLGRSCQSGAYLGSLRRTQIGDYNVDDSLTVEQACEFIDHT